MKSRKTSKSNVVSTKPLAGVGSQPQQSAKIGGVGNNPNVISVKKGK